MQAPILNAAVDTDARFFASELKRMNTACAATSRIAITGSSMITLLETFRTLRPNGYALWDAMSRVHLGAALPPASTAVVAETIVAHRARSWPAAVSAFVTPEYVQQRLTPAAGELLLTAPRPALVAHLADLMGKADVGSPAEVAALAISALKLTLMEVAKCDVEAVLKRLGRMLRQQLLRMASGTITRADFRTWAKVVDMPDFEQLLATVCDLDGAVDSRLQLLAPYPAIFATVIAADGTLLVK